MQYGAVNRRHCRFVAGHAGISRLIVGMIKNGVDYAGASDDKQRYGKKPAKRRKATGTGN
jgi:hypothetical protein